MASSAAATPAAMSAARMHDLDETTLDLVLDLVRRRLAMSEAPLDHPGSADKLAAALDGLLTADGRPAAEVLSVYEEHVAKAVISCDSPRFLTFIPAAPTKAALLFDMVVSAASLQGISWLEAAGAVAAENQVLRWLADAAGMPSSAGGCFVTGGSAGNLSALAVARDTGVRRHSVTGRASVAVSDQAHSSVLNTLHLLGMDAFLVPTSDHRLTGAALATALESSPVEARQVVAVVATAGTTNAGIVDDLAGVGAVARERGLWFHVDGAYGGAGLLAPSVRPSYDGIELCDSLVVDPHKWLFAPFDCAALVYREPWLAKAVHTQDASYLDCIHTSDTEWNPTDYAYHLTRRARGLPLWFSLAVNGTAAYTDAIEHTLSLARSVARVVDAAPQLELLREPTLGVVLFRRAGWTAADYDAWSARLLADQTAFVTSTTWEGEVVGRLAFLHPRTTLAMVEDILATTA